VRGSEAAAMSYESKESQLLAALHARCEAAGLDWHVFRASREQFVEHVLQSRNPIPCEASLAIWKEYEGQLRQLYPAQVLDPLVLPISLLEEADASSGGRERAPGGALGSPGQLEQLLWAVRTSQKRFIVWKAAEAGDDRQPAAAAAGCGAAAGALGGGPGAAGGEAQRLTGRLWSQQLAGVWSSTMLPALCGGDPLAGAEAAAAAGPAGAAPHAPPAAELLAAAAAAAAADPSKAVKYDDLVENEADVHGVSANVHTSSWRRGVVSKAQLGEDEVVAQVGAGRGQAGRSGGWEGGGGQRSPACCWRAGGGEVGGRRSLAKRSRRGHSGQRPGRPMPLRLPPPTEGSCSCTAPAHGRRQLRAAQRLLPPPPPHNHRAHTPNAQVLSEAGSGRRGRLYITDGCVPGCVPGCDSSDPGLTCLVNNAGDALVPRAMRTTRAESLSHAMMVGAPRQGRCLAALQAGYPLHHLAAWLPGAAKAGGWQGMSPAAAVS
jgi:hypothetical protein